MFVEVIDISLEKKTFVRGKGVEMVNRRTGEFVMFNGATWLGRGANFLYHYPRHRQSGPLKARNDKSWKHQEKSFLKL